ncbi:hypothetical protein NL676_000761 [Syzygium grande]|nr:hypothetical protein NL676_000761 [Syzygium grande]
MDDSKGTGRHVGRRGGLIPSPCRARQTALFLISNVGGSTVTAPRHAPLPSSTVRGNPVNSREPCLLEQSFLVWVDLRGWVVPGCMGTGCTSVHMQRQRG